MHEEIGGPDLVRFVTGECTPEESRRILEWAGEDPTRAELLESLTRLWAVTRPGAAEWDVDRAWERLVTAHMQDHEEESAETLSPAPIPLLAGRASVPVG